jgi:hypothetical protein
MPLSGVLAAVSTVTATVAARAATDAVASTARRFLTADPPPPAHSLDDPIAAAS